VEESLFVNGGSGFACQLDVSAIELVLGEEDIAVPVVVVEFHRWLL
jgi:hypothetical protein